ncbi:hypothetical protein HMPREF9318_00078 [Streptococcus urinalis FB127-CNA-2]|uniref:hypothetical protein n=1 Tax=Streptococcus urinalis TaxID=149016 RepID=UPI000225C83A|nr:hypothetical protein [Streptococcus urinalis]EKS21880.1 hypothetical protein HMPREF9318_00078 [Streptococcus urinalis FB127-CNA-2]VEF31693.1 Uncharacterised protein [Streptococcus urinalis]
MTVEFKIVIDKLTFISSYNSSREELEYLVANSVKRKKMFSVNTKNGKILINPNKINYVEINEVTE